MEIDKFEEANKKVHKVETQWHFPILSKFGFEATIKEAPGFVRDYDYQNSSGYRMRLTTGVSSDYWTDLQTKKIGYWLELEPYLLSLKGKV